MTVYIKYNPGRQTIKARPERLGYNLGEMRSEGDDDLRWESEYVASELAVQIAERVAGSPSYKAVFTQLGSKQALTYFEKRIKDEIYPAIRALAVVQWRRRNGSPLTKPVILWDDHYGLGPSLVEVWPDTEAPLELGPAWTWRSARRVIARRGVWLIKRFFHHLNIPRKIFLPQQITRQPFQPPATRPSMVAQHFAEGIDMERRSDLFWFPGSGVPAQQVVVHYHRGQAYTRGLRTSAGYSLVETLGMRWVEMDKSVADPSASPALNRLLPRGDLLSTFRRQSAPSKAPGQLDCWVRWASEFLLQEVEYWRSFYTTYNIKVQFEPEEGLDRNVAQCIALDLGGGVHIGKQRSECLGWKWSCLGYHPCHVFFNWSSRGVNDLDRGRNRVKRVLVSGFPNDGLFEPLRESSRSIRSRLEVHGAKFVVALFDESFGQDFGCSRSMMARFYTRFLRWAIDDAEVGLVIKSKKAPVIEDLPEIHDALNAALATGRCVSLSQPQGRLPAEASQAADISVGICVSSAVTEAVIAGGRGVHCDLNRMEWHDFYEWGYESLIFDDLDRLMSALERYKEDPASEPLLGDFSEFIDRLDPFRDGRAGERIGVYIKWLLEEFDKGSGRDEAIQNANERYGCRWGQEMVI